MNALALDAKPRAIVRIFAVALGKATLIIVWWDKGQIKGVRGDDGSSRCRAAAERFDIRKPGLLEKICSSGAVRQFSSPHVIFFRVTPIHRTLDCRLKISNATSFDRTPPRQHILAVIWLEDSVRQY